MAIASDSLNKLTVPLSDEVSGTLLMPKLKFRFRVELDSFGVSGSSTIELTKQVIDISRPSVSWDEIPIDIYNSKVYLAGKHQWEAITLNVRDDASGEVSSLIGQQLSKQLDFYEQASAVAGIDYKFTLWCEVLDGGNGAHKPNVLESWGLVGCYIASANYNDLNYGSSEPATITLSIRFDNAILNNDQREYTTKGRGNWGYFIGGAVGDTITGSGAVSPPTPTTSS